MGPWLSTMLFHKQMKRPRTKPRGPSDGSYHVCLHSRIRLLLSARPSGVFSSKPNPRGRKAISRLLQQPLILDPLLPQHRGVDVDVLAFAVDRDGDGEIADLEFVDRFHAEVGEADDLAALDRARHEIGGAAARHQIVALVLGDRLRRGGAAVGLSAAR